MWTSKSCAVATRRLAQPTPQPVTPKAAHATHRRPPARAPPPGRGAARGCPPAAARPPGRPPPPRPAPWSGLRGLLGKGGRAEMISTHPAHQREKARTKPDGQSINESMNQSSTHARTAPNGQAPDAPKICLVTASYSSFFLVFWSSSCSHSVRPCAPCSRSSRALRASSLSTSSVLYDSWFRFFEGGHACYYE